MSFEGKQNLTLSSDLLDAFMQFFVNRIDAYATQTSEGSYSKVDAPLTIDVIMRHLRGQKTIGLYQLDQDNNVKWLCFDLDLEKLTDPMETAAKNLNPKTIEIFPKQTELTKDRPYGNLVKAPLGLHRKARKWSRFLDLETFEPLSREALCKACGCTFSEVNISKIGELADKQHGLQTKISYNIAANFKDLKDKEERRIAKFLAKYWKEGYRNNLCMAFLGWAIKRGVSFESAYRIVDEVAKTTDDEERVQRLEQVKYHYKTRRSMGAQLLGISGLKEIVKRTLQ